MSDADTLLYLDGVTVTFDGFRALNALSLVLDEGEMRAMIGPNGAGKTTMMDVITGKTRPDSGKVVFGKDTDLTKLDEPAIASLGHRAEVPEADGVRAAYGLGQPAAGAGRRPQAAVQPVRAGDGGGEAADRVDILETTRLTDQRNRRGADLSHGQKQWLEIGMLLAQEPQLLLVDEPVAGMTDAETEQTADAAAGDQQDPQRGGGRARHGVRPGAGCEGDGAARRIGAVGGLDRFCQR